MNISTLYKPVISSVGHGVLVVVGVLAGWFLLHRITPFGPAEGAYMALGAGLFFYTQREISDWIKHYAEWRAGEEDWRDFLMDLADGVLDLAFPWVMGIVTMALLT